MRIVLRVLLGIVLGLVLAEGAVRVYLDWIPPHHTSYVSDPQAGYRLRPQSPGEDTTDLHVNSLGFRDREHAAHKAPGTWRVVGIGDSFVFGEVHLRDNFLRIAEARCNQAANGHNGSSPAAGAAPTGEPGRESPSPPIEMYLMGLGGYSPENYLGVLRSTALSIQPDLVLLCFFVGNDVTGIPTRSKVLHGELYGISSANPWLNLLRKSRLFVFAERYVFFRLRASRLRDMRAHEGGTPAAPEARASAAPDSNAPAPAASPDARESSGLMVRFYDLVEEDRLPVYLRLPSAAMEELWREAEGYLTDFDRTCKAAGVPWAMIIEPDEIQVDPQVRDGLLRRAGRSIDSYDFDLPQRRLKDFASRHSVPVCDLLPILRANHRPDARLYLPNDTHWSVRGNEVAGVTVADFVQGVIRDRQALAKMRRPPPPSKEKAAAPSKEKPAAAGREDPPPAGKDQRPAPRPEGVRGR